MQHICHSTENISNNKQSLGVGLTTIVRQTPFKIEKIKILVVPGFYYRGKQFEFNGIQLKYTPQQPFKTQLSLSLKPKFGAYDEKDASHLNGMADRTTTAIFGFSFQRRTAKFFSIQGDYHVDIFNTFNGSIANLRLGTALPIHSSTFIFPSIGINWLSTSTAKYDYGVKATESNAVRPFFTPTSTTNQITSITSITKFKSNWLFLTNTTWTRLGNEIKDSPLIKKDNLTTMIISLNYLF